MAAAGAGGGGNNRGSWNRTRKLLEPVVNFARGVVSKTGSRLAQNLAAEITGRQTHAQKYAVGNHEVNAAKRSFEQAWQNSGAAAQARAQAAAPLTAAPLTAALLGASGAGAGGPGAGAGGRLHTTMPFQNFLRERGKMQMRHNLQVLPYWLQSARLSRELAADEANGYSRSVPQAAAAGGQQSIFLGDQIPVAGRNYGSGASVLMGLRPPSMAEHTPSISRSIRISTINRYERIMRLYLDNDQRRELLSLVNYDGPHDNYIPSISNAKGRQFYTYDFIKKVLNHVERKQRSGHTRRLGTRRVARVISIKEFRIIVMMYAKLLAG